MTSKNHHINADSRWHTFGFSHSLVRTSWGHLDDQRRTGCCFKRPGYPPSYAKANKMKSLTLHACGCLSLPLRLA